MLVAMSHKPASTDKNSKVLEQLNLMLRRQGQDEKFEDINIVGVEVAYDGNFASIRWNRKINVRFYELTFVRLPKSTKILVSWLNAPYDHTKNQYGAVKSITLDMAVPIVETAESLSKIYDLADRNPWDATIFHGMIQSIFSAMMR